MSRSQRQAIAFMAAIYRNGVGLGAEGRTSCCHAGSKASSAEQTNDSDCGNPCGGPTAHTQRRNCCVICVHFRLPLVGRIGSSAFAAPLHNG
jgi:hypothetical protein